MAGVFAGLAAGVKYTGLINMALLAAVLLFMPALDTSFRGRLGNAAVLMFVGMVVCLPWYVRNTLQLGTPIYPPPPLVSRFVQAKAFPSEAVSEFQEYIRERGKGYGRGPLELGLLPLNVTYRPAAFHGAGGIGLVPLAFLPFVRKRSRRNAVFRSWWLWSGLFVLAWFVTQQEARFLIPVLGVTAAVGAIGAQDLWLAGPRITRTLVGFLVAMSVAYGGLTDCFTHREKIASVFSKRAEAKRIAAIPARDAFDFLNSSPEVKSVLVLSRYLPCYFLHKPYLKVRGQYLEEPIPGVPDVKTALKQAANLHVTHILDVQGLFGFPFELTEPPDPNELVFSSPDAHIYRVVAVPNAASAP